MEFAEPDRPTTREQHNKPRWRHYFTATVTGAAPELSKVRASGEVKGVRRIVPDDKGRPHLVTAESIVATTVDIDESFRRSQDAESLMFGSSSRPMTPADFEERLSSPISTAPSKRSRPGADTVVDEPPPRRSFSISNLLSQGPSSKKSSLGTSFSDKLLRRGRNRISSAPTRMITTKQSIELQHERERPPKRRDLNTPHGTTYSQPSTTSRRYGSLALPMATPLAPLVTPTPPKNVSATLLIDEKSTLVHEDLPPPMDQSPLASKLPPTMAGRYSRHRLRPSVSHSEQASTIAGSDVDTRGMSSGDEDDTDMTSETHFDSVRTRATRSTSGAGARGARIETIFDESPPNKSSKTSLSNLQDQLPAKALTDLNLEAASWADNDAISTPTGKVRSVHPVASPHDFENSPVATPQFHSSPPDISHMTLSHKLQLQTQRNSGEEMEWSFGDSEPESMRDASATDNDDDGEDMEYERVATPLSLRRSNPLLVDYSSSSSAATPQHLIAPTPTNPNRDSATRSSIFDWCEPTDSPGNRSPPRPKTVHGKKQPGPRGTRAVSRRAPSALHTRSQSVPAVPDVTGKREAPPLPNKFGTWGAGKAAAEEWDEDFDFPDAPVSQDSTDAEEKRVDSVMTMFVPQSIRDQQSTVIHNSTLLREMSYLIDQLESTRRRAITLGLHEGEHAQLFKDVDAIITLAVEDSEDGSMLPKWSPPSSPGFDADAFEEEPGAAAVERVRRKAARSSSARYSEPVIQMSGAAARHRRKSVLPPNDRIFSPPSPTHELVAAMSDHGSSPPGPKELEVFGRARPRKDSEARARAVIEKIQNKNNDAVTEVAEFEDLPLQPEEKKVPFDAATLRNIVPYVRVLVDRAKEAVRVKEGLYHSPNVSPKQREEPEFSHMFKDAPPDSSPSARRRRVSRNVAKAMNNDEICQTVENDLSTQMKLMTVM